MPTTFELRLKPYYHASANDCSHKLPRSGELVRCTTEGCKHNLKHSTIPHLMMQGAPLRCHVCRSACWKCGRPHRYAIRNDSVPELCKMCQRTELLQTMSAYDDDSRLPYPILSVARSHIEHYSYLPCPGETLAVIAALLRKAPNDHHWVPCSIAKSEESINTLKSLGVKEWVIKDFKSAAIDREARSRNVCGF